jgi:transcriptional regulator with XRE-family HTH domain
MSSDVKQLGRVVREARNRCGLGTPRLAERVSVHQTTLVRLERGEIARPDPALLMELSQQLDLPLAELYELAGIPLPSLRPYLRAEYGLSEGAIDQIQDQIIRIATHHQTGSSGPLHGIDENPER